MKDIDRHYKFQGGSFHRTLYCIYTVLLMYTDLEVVMNYILVERIVIQDTNLTCMLVWCKGMVCKLFKLCFASYKLTCNLNAVSLVCCKLHVASMFYFVNNYM